MKTPEFDAIVSLFHENKPLSVSVKEIRLQEHDSRWILYVTFPERKYVIKIAANGFTTEPRINAWVPLIRAYCNMGYYSPALSFSRNGNYAEKAEFRGKRCIIWEEEFARYFFPEDLDERVYQDGDGRYLYWDEVIAFMGRIGQLHLSGFPGKSGWVRLEPFSENETTDETTEYVESFDDIVRKEAPHFLNRWLEIKELYDENLKRLKEIYNQLPKSVFQADWGLNNLLLDELGHFKGVIDYNLAGEDTVLNMFLSMILWSECGHSNRDKIVEIMLDTLGKLKQYYTFSELEVKAAPLLYKYISTIEYSQIEVLQKSIGNDAMLKELFDQMEWQLRQDDIDFFGAMMESESRPIGPDGAVGSSSEVRNLGLRC